MRLRLLVGAACALVAAAPASAALTYHITGVFSHPVYNTSPDGPLGAPPFKFDVSFILDGAEARPDGRSILYYGSKQTLIVNGVVLDPFVAVGGYEFPDGVSFAFATSEASGFSEFGIIYDLPGVNRDIASQEFFDENSPTSAKLTAGDTYDQLSDLKVTVSGTRPLPPVPYVPEPATWAMMLAGFGMIGFAARRRQSVKATVAFA